MQNKRLQALIAFAFSTTRLIPEEIIEPTRIVQMGVEPVQIHVMSAISENQAFDDGNRMHAPFSTRA